MIAYFIAASFVLAIIAMTAWIAHEIGRRSGHNDTRSKCEMAERALRAADDLDRWCGFSSPHARLIARHFQARIRGHGLNAGTPVGDEACQIQGLREQLRRIDAKAAHREGGAA